MALIGYARVSTRDQDLGLQIDKLIEFGCDKIFTEKQSGAKSEREELSNAMDYLRSGDKLVVYKIDRLARSTFDLHKIVRELDKRDISIVFIKEQIDFSPPAGKLMFTMLGAIVEFERDLINERTSEGRERAKAQGKHMGRKGQDEKCVKQAMNLFFNRTENGLSVNDISKMTGVPRSTFYAKAKELKKEVKVNETSEKEGIKVNIDKMEVTPMSFIVFFNQEESKALRSIWDSADVELEIKDDLGNRYAGEGNGGTGTVAEPHKSSWSATFQKLNENATKLIVTPHVHLQVHTPENHGGVEYVNGKEKKIEVPKKKRRVKILY